MWNPPRPVVRGRLGRLWPARRPAGNFGDLLGPFVVRHVLDELGIVPTDAPERARLLSIGSVLHLAHPADVVWGAGVNGKEADLPAAILTADVRAVRGPRTRDVLRRRGVDVPEVFGDPGLLVGRYLSRETIRAREGTVPLTVVPHLYDPRPRGVPADAVLDPRSELRACLRRVARSERVVSSSLHGVVVAEAFGVPARLVAPRREHALKYEDYFLGTGRDARSPAASFSVALDEDPEPPPRWSADALLAAFPRDLWAAD